MTIRFGGRVAIVTGAGGGAYFVPVPAHSSAPKRWADGRPGRANARRQVVAQRAACRACMRSMSSLARNGPVGV